MKHLVIVSGYSGAGKTLALHALEDAGYVVIDNIPLALLPAVVETALEEEQRLAVSSDIRTRGFSVEDFAALLASLKARPGLSCRLLMLTADAESLIGRFKETRRPHPLAKGCSLEEGIRLELARLAPLIAYADEVLDSTDLTPRELQREVQQRFAGGVVPFQVELVSFSYKYGIPRGADLVFDVRFLKNPHYVEALRPHTGLEAAVGAYILQDSRFQAMLERVQELVLMTLPWYKEEGKRLLTVAIGCTGGRHRSVFTAQCLGDALRQAGVAVMVRHREIDVVSG